jgi:type II secretory pathway pseudopilin PulG
MHGRTHRTIGLTLIEMTLVVATIALMVGLALPAVKGMMHSFQSQGAARSMINAALNSARTMAVSKQRCVGIRFQSACTSDDPLDPLKGLLDAPQYLIFIMYEERKAMDNMSNGFLAVEGLAPIKLPETIGVMDLTAVTSNASMDTPAELNNATAFSIVFSPSGRVLVQDVRVRNRDGWYQPDNTPGSTKPSMDDVFNSTTNITNIIQYQCGMFIQDDYPALGLAQEPSRTGFVIYDRSTFRRVYEKRTAWTQYLQGLKSQSLYVSPYTGHLISPE